ncbi:MAG: hypothetical protein HOA33_07600 [Gammaproteobacteria bacterium]|jgi:hypothetical protein|nr:hypothetical protein [Gammaproteobacteria bacterium]MBT3988595.1 hypothetical protein [Gammaproteobacteria bacterium]MBT4255147.1 hypothetical protein [Gammaproteobacteria bacterium]MBT4580467.1 hypothetical protein [Gammaproteobacteria bacterium]MBT4657799.1 hypothetical protein [Gammaproteobacteria bacterium]
MKISTRHLALTALFGLTVQAPLAMAQEDGFSQISSANSSFRIAPSSVLSGATPLLSIERNIEEKDFQGGLVEDALNFNLGVELEPLPGFSVRADAWQLEVDEAPAVKSNGSDWQNSLPQLYIEDSEIHEFNLDNPLLGSNVESNGFDLGAAYVWETTRFGQFTLSTKATYVEEFENKGGLLDLATTEIGAIEERVISPELQSSLMLTWEFGNHTASAVTNYFDSYKNISELDIEEINDLVDNITTVDLQYGYSVKTGSNRAVISFGIRNIFDEQTAQILNSNTRILDQNGRVAYGSIKYQF